MTTEYLLGKEVERVLAALTPSNRTIARVMLHTGLRLGDVLRLQPQQLQRQFWIVEQKTGKRRRVGLTDVLLDELRRVSGKYYVFEGRLNPEKHKTRQAVYADVKRAAKAFRMPQNVAPHSFRKVYAVGLLDKYGSIERVQRALNHSNPMTTMVYAVADKLLSVRRKK